MTELLKFETKAYSEETPNRATLRHSAQFNGSAGSLDGLGNLTVSSDCNSSMSGLIFSWFSEQYSVLFCAWGTGSHSAHRSTQSSPAVWPV